MEIGEYVRTIQGYICKIVKKTDAPYEYEEEEGYWVNETDIKVHSKNIIDLIEVGDFIKVLDNGNRNEYTYMMFDNLSIENVKKHIKNNDYKIISIETKEQFEENSYKVVE